MLPATTTYEFRGGGVYNLEASDIIKNGDGASGAHSDITHAEVAHAFWQAALTPLYAPKLAEEGGLLLGLGRGTVHGKIGSLGADPVIATEIPSPKVPRWINAELKDHAPQEPLSVGQWYLLAFDVDVTKHTTAVGSAVFEESQLFPKGTDEMQLTVQLDSIDFEISDPVRTLRISRVGPSQWATGDSGRGPTSSRSRFVDFTRVRRRI